MKINIKKLAFRYFIPYYCRMESAIKYQGRQATFEEIAQINSFIDCHPDYSRRRLSQELCKLWNWRYSSGYLKD